MNTAHYIIEWKTSAGTQVLHFEAIESLEAWLEKLLKTIVADDDEELIKFCGGELADGLCRLAVYQEKGYGDIGEMTLFKRISPNSA